MTNDHPGNNVDDSLPDYCQKSVLVLGVGNRLFGDDGFGPNVIRFLEDNHEIPSEVCVYDVGLSVREILFNIIISDKKPKRIIIVDAVDKGRKPGEVFRISVDEMPEKKIDDFSMHQVPSSNLLKELKDLGEVDIVVIACQVEKLPEEVDPGLSNTVRKALPIACEEIIKEFEL